MEEREVDGSCVSTPCHSVSVDPLTHFPLSTSLLASHTLSPSLCFIPLLLIYLNLCGAPPSSPHHLSLSLPLFHSLSLSLTSTSPSHTPPPPCCFGAAACLLATTAHPLELSECFYKHTQEDTLIREFTRSYTTHPH